MRKLRKCLNWPLHLLARFVPGTALRVLFHRWRGVQIGSNVFIGDEVYLENNYPECIQIGDNVQIGIRTIIICAGVGVSSLKMMFTLGQTASSRLRTDAQ